MLKRFFRFCLAVFFPWLALLIEDNPGGALLAIIMQASIIGWIPASVWAWRTMNESSKIKEAEKRKAKAAKKAAKNAEEEKKENEIPS